MGTRLKGRLLRLWVRMAIEFSLVDLRRVGWLNLPVMVSQQLRWVWAGLILVSVTAFYNVGIIALDDYSDVVSRIIPAGHHSFEEHRYSAGIRSPVPSLLLLGGTKAADYFGFQNPAMQLRWVLLLIGIFSFLVHSWAGREHFRGSRGEERSIVTFLMSFYFLCPLFFSRVMIEALSAPFLVLSALYACRYFGKPNPKDLSLALWFLVASCVLRFQVGVCYVALLAVVLMARRPKDLALFLFQSGVAFVLTGVLDLWLRGEFHGSVRAYIAYNSVHLNDYGTMPFYTFLLLFVGLSLPPAFFLRYRAFEWKKSYRPLLPTGLYFATFLLAHSLPGHKEDRYMVPVLGLFLILLVPLANYIVQNARYRWRLYYFLGLNLVLLLVTAFTIPQNNIIGTVLWLGERPQVTTIHSVDEALVLFPSAYVAQPLQLIKTSSNQLDSIDKNCSAVLASRDRRVDIKLLAQGFERVGKFSPGPLEWVAVQLNPKRNSRRDTISLWANRGCKF